MKLVNILLTGAAAMLLPACDGMFEGIYDAPEASSDYGFVSKCAGNTPGTIYINATDYTRWTYVHFDSQSIDTLSVADEAPAEWDIAVHRYDAKTNGATVSETPLTDITQIRAYAGLAGLEQTADEWTTTTIVTDMSTMMDGYLSYAESFYNPTLSRWLNVDTSTMPPIYTPSGKVYVVCLRNGRKAAVRLQDYMDAAGIKGYMTIQYIYPL